jgi:hypothetical protein
LYLLCTDNLEQNMNLLIKSYDGCQVFWLHVVSAFLVVVYFLHKCSICGFRSHYIFRNFFEVQLWYLTMLNFERKSGKWSLNELSIHIKCQSRMKWKTKQYHTISTIPKSNNNMVEGGKIDTPSKKMHDRSLSSFGTSTPIKCDEVKLV